MTEVLRAAEEPEVTYEQPARGDGEEMRQRGDVAVGVNALTRTVKTVLLRSPTDWEHGEHDRETAP